MSSLKKIRFLYESRKEALCGKEGFTLLEILLATLMMAVLLLALRSVFRSAMDVRQECQERIRFLRRVQRLERLLREDVQGMIFTGSELAPEFSLTTDQSSWGQSSYLEFYTTSGRIQTDKPWPDIQRVSYYLLSPQELQRYGYEITNELGAVLVRAVQRNLLNDLEEEPTPMPLCPDVAEFQVEVYDGSDWYSEWTVSQDDEEPQMPKALRISITFAQDPFKKWTRWPIELVIPCIVEAHAWTNAVETGQSSTNQPPPSPTPGPQPPGPQPPGGGGHPAPPNMSPGPPTTPRAPR